MTKHTSQKLRFGWDFVSYQFNLWQQGKLFSIGSWGASASRQARN